MCTTIVIGATVAVLAACSRGEVTREGTGLVQQDTSSLIPAEVRDRLSGATRTEVARTVPVGAGNDAVLAARFATVRDPQAGGSYIDWVRIVVRKNERYLLAASAAGAPTNRGTAERPVMALDYTVTWSEERTASTRSGTRRFELVADGRLDLR